MMYGYPTMYGGGYGFGWLGLVFDVLVWGLVIWLVVALVHRLTHGGEGAGCCGRHTHGQSSSGHALDIAKERYAKGEITKEQFDALKQDLQ